MKESVTMTQDQQVEAFENAAEVVEQDVEDGLLDADKWGGDVKDGEIVRLLAEAYTGTIEFEE